MVEKCVDQVGGAEAFFQPGGRVIHIFDAITSNAISNSEAYDDGFFKKYLHRLTEQNIGVVPGREEEKDRVHGELLMETDVNEQHPSIFEHTIRELRGEKEGKALDFGYSTAPTCANDEEFGRVREMLGLARNKNWGPYFLGEDENEMETDCDFDDDSD